jgi:hypothetical protein
MLSICMAQPRWHHSLLVRFDSIVKVFQWIPEHWTILCVISMPESTLTLDSLEPVFITDWSSYQGSGWLPWDQVASCPTGRLCTNGCFKATAQVPLQMLGLQKLLLSGIGGVRDEMVTELAMLLRSSLEKLHLLVLWFSSVCDFYLRFRLLTDAAVVRVSACCQKCKSFGPGWYIAPLLSDMAIGCLATDGHWSLRVLSLKCSKLRYLFCLSLDDFELLNILGGFCHCYGLLLHAESAPIGLVTCQKTGCKLEGK